MGEDNTSNKSSSVKKVLWICGGAVLAVVIGVAAYLYISKAEYYKDVFFPGTVINNVDAGLMTPAEVKEILKNQTKDYSITVKSRDREPQVLTSSDVGLEYVLNDSVDSILSYQDIWSWPLAGKQDHTHEVSQTAAIDEGKLANACESLNAWNDKTAQKPTDAYISEYNESIGAYEIVDCYDGNKILDKNQAMAIIREAMLTLQPEVNLDSDEYDLYTKADVQNDDAALVKRLEALNKFSKSEITYIGCDLVVDGKIIDTFIIDDENGDPALNNDKIADYVTNVVALSLDTVGTTRKFKSAWGNEVEVSGGSYGWKVDQEAETEELVKLISETSVVTRDAVYSQTAATHDMPDWGDTYVEVNILRQHQYTWVDGKVVTDSNIVTGTENNKSRYTPSGVYAVNYKVHGAVLRGPRRADGTYSYESKVTYWMPFNKGIGLHDATWRGSFGGNTYLYSGSHGCVNLPYKAAQEIFNSIEVGCPVIVYRYETPEMTVEPERAVEETETETKADNKKKTTTTTKKNTVPVATSPAATIAPSENVPPEILPGETIPAETVPETAAATTEGAEVGPGMQTETAPAVPEVGPGV